jgi:hypothetical protein
MKENTEYIGDGVYVMFDGMGWWLYANDPESPTDSIYLEDFVASQLIKKIKADEEEVKNRG